MIFLKYSCVSVYKYVKISYEENDTCMRKNEKNVLYFKLNLHLS